MSRRPFGCRRDREGWGCRGGRDVGGGVLDGVEELAAEVVHAGGEVAELAGELVVADDGGDGDEDAGGGGDEGFGDTWGHRAEGGCTGGAEAVEGVNDAPDGAEEADEGRGVGDGGKPGDAGLHEGEGFARGGGGGAFEPDGIAGEAAAVGLAVVLVVDFGEDGDQRRGAELLGGGGDFGQAAGFTEGAQEAGGLVARGGEGAELGEDDGPGEEAHNGEQDEDAEGDGAGVVEDLGDGRAVGTGGEGRGGGVRVGLEQEEECGSHWWVGGLR